MTDRFNGAIALFPPIRKATNAVERCLICAWFDVYSPDIAEALTLATESEQLRKERDVLRDMVLTTHPYPDRR